MTAVRVITTPSLEGKRRAFILAEDRIGHYPEFRVAPDLGRGVWLMCPAIRQA